MTFNNRKLKIGKKARSKKRALLILYDLIIIQCVSFFSLWLRYEFNFSNIPPDLLKHIGIYTLVNTPVTIILFKSFRIYENIWSFAGFREFSNACFLSVASGVQVLVGTIIMGLYLPSSYYVIYTVFLAAGILLPRMLYVFIYQKNRSKEAGEICENLMLVGAGAAGNTLMTELMGNRAARGRVVCIIDDNPDKWGGYICGVRIEGGRKQIPKIAQAFSVDKIIIAMPSASKKTINDIVTQCRQTDCDISILPDISSLIDKKINVSMLREVRIEDLLGREQVEVNLDEIMDYVTGKSVLVTGGGGSIGSELCRQIATYNPKRLIILDIYENNAYDIQQELLRQYPELPLTVLIASVRDANRISQIFDIYRPEIVYHAAAHKHVPLMEENPSESVKNNIFGTLNTVKAAGKYNVQKFVLISTDKAVNPTSVMGATKRICEMLVQTMDKLYSTVFVAVRFGNVLDSNGSVIPLFKKQIRDGGPVTVTHRDVVRYFMTIPEAVSLVLQAGAYAKGGEIYILDMGDPVRIDDLARNLIKLSGFIPDIDIEVVYSGLRPGEKLFEELLLSEEGISPTENKMIFKGRQIDFNWRDFLSTLDELRTATEFDMNKVQQILCELVETYKPDAIGTSASKTMTRPEEDRSIEDGTLGIRVDKVTKGVAVV